MEISDTEVTYLDHFFAWDSISGSITMDGKPVYHESNTGEISVYDVMNGTEKYEDGRSFTFEDFVTEVLYPDLEERGVC